MISPPAFACTFCNREISEAIYGSAFYPNLLSMLSAFIVLAVIVFALWMVSAKKYSRMVALNPDAPLPAPVPLACTSIITGIGLGGFIDGIVLHQILQWHEMLSNKIPATDYVGKSVNMFWNGIFHAFCLVVLIIGIYNLWKLLSRSGINTSGKLFSGGLLGGWGLFNIVEGIIDHHILKLHNVFEFSAEHGLANYVFLGISAAMLIVGYALMAKGVRKFAVPGREVGTAP